MVSGLTAAPANAAPSSGMRITPNAWESSSSIHGLMEGRSFSAPGRIVITDNSDRTQLTFREEALAPGCATTPSMFVDSADSCTPNSGLLATSVTCPTDHAERWISLDMRDNAQPGREVVPGTVNWETYADTSQHAPMRLIGGPGIERVRSRSSGDYVEGGAGNDAFAALAADVIFVGGPGRDTVGVEPGTGGVRILAADGEVDQIWCYDNVALLSIDEGLDEVITCDSARYLPSLTARPVVTGSPRAEVPLSVARGTWTAAIARVSPLVR